MSKAHPVDLFIIPAEQRADQSFNTSYRLNKEERVEALYRPTTLVMTFPPGELEFIRRALNGQTE